ncbi:pilus assembly protein [Psychrobacter sp. T6-3]
MKGWPIKVLSTVVLACMATSAGHTSDREIYQAAQGGNASILMMLDNSISMNNNSILEDYPDIRFRFSGSDEIRERFYNDDGTDIGYIPYSVEYYRPSINGDKYYSRISRLKMALIPLFANPKSSSGFGADIDLTKYKIGLGSFFGGARQGGGQVDAPISDLTQANRISLIYKIAGLTPSTYTPIANAYAAAGAYMLKGNTSYSSPMPTTPAQCDGYGVYFLTDGEPNSVYSENTTRNLMNSSLSGSSLSVSNISDPKLPSARTYYASGVDAPTGAYVGTPGWELIGQYAKALNNDNNSKKDAIATATVGFGSVYKELYDRRTIVGGKDNYNCNDPSVESQDAKNLCNFGKKDQGFGEGGFYYTAESEDIAKSVKSFIKEVGETEIEPISAGTMSVPLDSLGGLESRQFAYLPILEPVPGSSQLWNGNLKKYKVRNATLLGGNNNFVFSDNSGLFAKNTYDLWNTVAASRPDRGLPQVGGAYQKVFENTGATASGSRNLFVNNGSSLVNLKVTADKKPVNFNNLTTANGYTNPKKIALLNFMGYGESTSTTVTDGTAITASLNTDLKNVGGVLHSIPQLITKKVAVDATGKFDTSQREDYVIYGSMDGALHMLDDSTGKEVFTFVPKQILDLQPKALAGNGTAEDGSYPYGVDAPWLTYASYTTKSNTTGTGDAATTTNTFEAEQSFALGGLRMGGSMYYALDVSTPSTPKMIYSVGSNYANKLQDQLGATPTVLAGTTSSTVAAEKLAFAKMGQSWGKPALGYVKSGGKRVMVSFLPGGYDTCYEDPKFKLGSTVTTNTVTGCNGKTTAQGNGVYMVQMGEVETKANNEEKVNVSTGNGKLLWWANNSDTSVTAASTATSASLQYSKADDLKHSVVTQIRTLDRNYDGLTDHIYFADLGGQVWRADINNNADTNNFKVDRVVKVLDVSDQVGTGDAPPRIYERPLITFYNGRYGYIDADNQSGTASGVQAMVTVGTGDRSNPVTATRSVPNALYSVIDKDVSRSDLFFYGTGTAPTISLRTPINKVAGTTSRNDKLQKLTFSAADISAAAVTGGAPARAGIKENMERGIVQGWYMPFDTWLNEAKQTTGPYKMKMFNEPDALAGILVSSSYNPDKGQAVQACSAGVKGATQRERTCLPFGTCLDSSGNAVVTARSTFNAGSGIVDNIVTQFNDTSIFSGLVNRCEGDDCTPKLICPNGDCDPEPPACTGIDCDPLAGFNTDKRINPLSWIEH